MSSKLKDIAAKIKEKIQAESEFSSYKFLFYSSNVQAGSHNKAAGNKISLSFLSDNFSTELQRSVVQSSVVFELETVFKATTTSTKDNISRLDDIQIKINAIESAIGKRDSLNQFLEFPYVRGINLRHENIQTQDLSIISIKTSITINYVKGI